jgi:hypothetical protein
LRQVKLVSTGSYLPGDPIDNEEMERLAGPVPEDVLEGLQVKTRHWCVDPNTGEHLESNSDMAYKAVVEALELAGMEPEEVELLIVSTASPEYHLPPTSTFVQEKLGLRGRGRGARLRAALPRAGRLRPRGSRGQRGDLTAVRGRVPGARAERRCACASVWASTASATARARWC